MRVNREDKITLIMLIGLVVYVFGSPVLTSYMQLGWEFQDQFTIAYTPHDAILLDGNAEMIAQATAESWPGNGTEGNPYQITGYSFYDVQHSVEIRNIDLYWTFTGNQIDGPYDTTVWCGIEISNSSNGYVADNDILGRFRGLWLIDIENVTITNNYIHDNLFHAIECIGYINGCLITENIMTRNEGSGIRILTAVDSEISGNTVTESDGCGIQVLGVTTNVQINDNYVDDVTGLGIHIRRATFTEIMHNNISNMSGDGIYIQESFELEIYNNTLTNGGDDGIVLVDSDCGLIHRNTIRNADANGIYASSGANSTFKFNTIKDSGDYGLLSSDESYWMNITQNFFYNNGDASQACDNGEGNVFIFNYYDDWVAPDVNSDLIVDLPYSINGTAGNEDPYPLADPDAEPIIPSEIIETTTTDTTPTSGTTTGTDVQIPLEIVMIAGGAVVIIIIGVLFVKRQA